MLATQVLPLLLGSWIISKVKSSLIHCSSSFLPEQMDQMQGDESRARGKGSSSNSQVESAINQAFYLNFGNSEVFEWLWWVGMPRPDIARVCSLTWRQEWQIAESVYHKLSSCKWVTRASRLQEEACGTDSSNLVMDQSTAKSMHREFRGKGA